MSAQKLTEATNSGYVSSEETDSLLVSNTPKCKPSVLRQIKMSSVNGPTSNTSSSSGKPTLIRQDRTSSYLTSPQLSQQARIGSEENVRVAILEDVEQGFRSAKVPGIEVHSHDDDRNLKHQQPTISISNINNYQPQDSFHPSSQTNQGTSSYQNLSTTIQPSVQNRCRACRNCSRRASTTPISTAGQMDRSASRESVKSAFQQGNIGGSMATCASINAIQQNVPPLLVTSSPTNGSRIIRQSSQPESCSSAVCCGAHSTCGHSHTVPNVSLKQLRDNTTDGFAGIAADSLRINGGMRPFKQVVDGFQKIELRNMPPAPEKIEFSTDSKYLYDMAHAISSGVVSVDLANIKPGKIVHSRWLTKAA